MLIKLRTGVRTSIWPKQSYRLLCSLNAMLHKTDKAGGGGGGWGSGSCKVPKRKEQIRSLRNEHFDILIVGGGAIGCGCALEAATRGFKTALIEAEDFASGASCKSSKLIEGSNSYLHAAIQGADLQQIFMLQQVLNERATMLTIAPHLNRVQPMLMPIYSPLRLPLYWLGLKMYDAMAGMSNVRGSHFLSKQGTLNEFPLLRKNGLLGSLIYYDVQLDDARMCLALAMTAVRHGATVANYVRLLELLPNCQQDCRAVLVEDALKEDSFVINTRVIINATGAGTDVLRKLDDCRVSPIAVPHLGTHIALPGYYGSQNCGLLFPSSDAYDDALIMLPFENRLLVGSMDVQRPEMTDDPPAPTADVVDCLLNHTRSVLDDCVQLREEDVLSAWTGIKPSILCPTTTTSDSADDCNQKAQQSNEVVPNFLLEVSGNQLITLAGGRWSTYRIMAIDAINTAIESCLLEPQSDESISSHLLLDGAENYCCMLPLDLVQAYDLPMDVAQHLAESYGSNAPQLLCNSKCSLPGSGHQRLHSQFPYIQAEVIYACQREYACHLVDVIARRLRVAFVDVRAAHEMLSTVLKLMSEELDWDERRQANEYRMAQKFLQKEMGLGCIIKPKRQQLKNNDDQSEQQEDLHSAIGDATFFCSALNPTNSATSHINTDSEPNYSLGSKPVQSMMSATKIASGSALVNEINPIHRSSMIRGTSSVGHLMRGIDMPNSSKDAKKWNTTVKRGKSDRTTDRSDRSDRSNRSDASTDKPPKPAAEPERLQKCSFSPYVIANSGPQEYVPNILDVKTKAKNISEMRTDPNRRFNRDMQKPKHKKNHKNLKTSEESELLSDNAGNNDHKDLHGSSGKALEGISRASNKVKSRKTSSAMPASEMDDMETEISKESVNKMKLRPKIFDPSAGRSKKFTSTEDKQIKYRIESLKSKSRDKSSANENQASPSSKTREANKTRRTTRNVSDINADSTTSTAAKKDTNYQSKQSASTTHSKGSEKPAISKPSHSSSNSNEKNNNNKRYVSTVSTGESDSATVSSTNIGPEVTIIMPNPTVSRMNALNNNNDKISERSIVGTAVELDTRLHDTAQILRNATTSLKKIKETMLKAKAMNQLQSKDAANAMSSSNHHIISDVRQPSTPCELIEVKQPKKVADETDKLLDRSDIENTKQKNYNDLDTNT